MHDSIHAFELANMTTDDVSRYNATDQLDHAVGNTAETEPMRIKPIVQTHTHAAQYTLGQGVSHVMILIRRYQRENDIWIVSAIVIVIRPNTASSCRYDRQNRGVEEGR